MPSPLSPTPNSHIHTPWDLQVLLLVVWCTPGRWGRTTCSNTSGTQLVYAGQAAGSYHAANGGGANYLCLPEQPQYSTFTTGAQSARAYLYGAEYETGNDSPGNNGVGPFRSFHDHNVPCAVCHTSKRGSVLMIPARRRSALSHT